MKRSHDGQDDREANRERGRAYFLQRYGYVYVTLLEGQDDTREAVLMLLWWITRFFFREYLHEISDAEIREAYAAANDGQ